MAARSIYDGFHLMFNDPDGEQDVVILKLDHDKQARFTLGTLIASNAIFALVLWICGFLWGTILQYLVFSTLFIGNIILLPLPLVFMAVTHGLPFFFSVIVFSLGDRIETAEFLAILFVWVIVSACEVALRILDRLYLKEIQTTAE